MWSAAPLSPAPLVQERPGVVGDPWRLLVVCLLCNRSRGELAYPVALELFHRWPTPEAMAAADPDEIEPLVRGLGFGRRRAVFIPRMSAEYVSGDWTRPEDLYGCGRYAADAWAIFVDGRDDVVPTDGHLLRYVRWRIAEGSWAVEV